MVRHGVVSSRGLTAGAQSERRGTGSVGGSGENGMRSAHRGETMPPCSRPASGLARHSRHARPYRIASHAMGCAWLRVASCVRLPSAAARQPHGMRATGRGTASGGGSRLGFCGHGASSFSLCCAIFLCLAGLCFADRWSCCGQARRPWGCPGLRVSSGCVLRVALHVVVW